VSQNGLKTAFVFAGGGSLGAVQVGMLQEVIKEGIQADFVVGSSVGALNAAYYASMPDMEGIARLAEIWRTLRRSDIFPVNLSGIVRLLRRRDHLIDPSSLRWIIERHIHYTNLEDAEIPVHVIATNVGGVSVKLSSGPAVEAILASAAIPVIFPAVRIGNDELVDAAVGSNTPIVSAAELGASRLIVFPTGFGCALKGPPRGPVSSGLHAITLLIAHQTVRDLRRLMGKLDISTVPALCPLAVSPNDFSNTGDLIERAAQNTRAWIDEGGLSRQEVPASLIAHTHKDHREIDPP
jgi:NTE family protein